MAQAAAVLNQARELVAQLGADMDHTVGTLTDQLQAAKTAEANERRRSSNAKTAFRLLKSKSDLYKEGIKRANKIVQRTGGNLAERGLVLAAIVAETDYLYSKGRVPDRISYLRWQVCYKQLNAIVPGPPITDDAVLDARLEGIPPEYEPFLVNL